jgi:hypothetical protein
VRTLLGLVADLHAFVAPKPLYALAVDAKADLAAWVVTGATPSVVLGFGPQLLAIVDLTAS